MKVRAEGTFFGMLGLAFLFLSWLAYTERLPRNDVVGIRTGATTANDAAWLASHRASAWSVALAGLILLATGALLWVADQSASNRRVVVLGSALAVVLVLVVGAIQADRVATSTTSSSDALAPITAGR